MSKLKTNILETVDGLKQVSVSDIVDKVDDSIGVGQSWQDMTASRASAIDYTNDTGKHIMVNVNSGQATAQRGVRMFVGGVQVLYVQDNNTGAQGALGGSMIVPSGDIYSVTITGSVTGEYHWAELR